MERDAVKEWPRTDIVTEWWSEVKEHCWEHDVRPHMKPLLTELMQRTMSEALERIRRRDTGTVESLLARKGYDRRSLITHRGLLQDIRVPRRRRGGFHTPVFRRSHRCEPLVEALIRDVWLAGISTRRVGAAVCALRETQISSSTGSRITRSLDAHVRRVPQRPRLDESQSLIREGLRLKIRAHGRDQPRTVLVADGITLFGPRVLRDFRPAKGESQTAWDVLLSSLAHRGLLGAHLRLIVMEGSAGLRAAAEWVYAAATIQRCWVQKLRTVATACPKKPQGACVRQARTMYLAAHRLQAQAAFQRWQQAWRRRCPKAVACLEQDLEARLSFFDCPVAHRLNVRTTHALERSFREVRRRTNVFSCCSNTASPDRMLSALFTHVHHGWKDAPLSGFTQF